jgi:predicted DNA-binding transcriptional regulator AlpA
MNNENLVDSLLIRYAEKQTETILKGVKDQLAELKKELAPKEPEELLKPAKVSELFQVSLTTIYEWSKPEVGLLKPFKMGNRTFFLRSQIMETLLKSNTKI